MITRAPVAIAVAAILACNQGLEPALAPTSCPNGFVGVCGTVSFAGQLPESTAKVFIVAFDTFPKSQNDLFKFKPQPSPPTLPLGPPPSFSLHRPPSLPGRVPGWSMEKYATRRAGLSPRRTSDSSVAAGPVLLTIGVIIAWQTWLQVA